MCHSCHGSAPFATHLTLEHGDSLSRVPEVDPSCCDLGIGVRSPKLCIVTP